MLYETWPVTDLKRRDKSQFICEKVLFIERAAVHITWGLNGDEEVEQQWETK